MTRHCVRRSKVSITSFDVGNGSLGECPLDFRDPVSSIALAM